LRGFVTYSTEKKGKNIMRKLVLAVLTSLCIIGTAPAQAKESAAKNSKRSLERALQSVGSPSGYDARYEAVILPLCRAGINLFTECNFSKDSPEYCYCYSGTEEQNHKLKRNIVKNRNLFVKGKIPEENLKKWVIVP
jgi:hypothetical protein